MANQDKFEPRILRQKTVLGSTYTIVQEQVVDFSMYKDDQLLLNSMSLNKIDRHWDGVFMFIK